MESYTSRSHWPDGHWIVSLSQFCDENGRLPQDGQYVPQCVIDRLAAYEEVGLTPEGVKTLLDCVFFVPGNHNHRFSKERWEDLIEKIKMENWERDE